MVRIRYASSTIRFSLLTAFLSCCYSQTILLLIDQLSSALPEASLAFQVKMGLASHVLRVPITLLMSALSPAVLLHNLT